MKVQSVAESMSSEDGVTQIAFDLTGSDAGYLIVSTPDDARAAEEFFGHNHYVEVKDQLFGRYGGLASLKIRHDNEVEIGLTYDVAGVGRELTVVARAAMQPSILSHLRSIERL